MSDRFGRDQGDHEQRGRDPRLSDDFSKFIEFGVGALSALAASALKEAINKRGTAKTRQEDPFHNEEKGEPGVEPDPELRGSLKSKFDALRVHFDEETAFSMTISAARTTLKNAIKEAKCAGADTRGARFEG